MSTTIYVSIEDFRLSSEINKLRVELEHSTFRDARERMKHQRRLLQLQLKRSRVLREARETA